MKQQVDKFALFRENSKYKQTVERYTGQRDKVIEIQNSIKKAGDENRLKNQNLIESKKLTEIGAEVGLEHGKDLRYLAKTAETLQRYLDSVNDIRKKYENQYRIASGNQRTRLLFNPDSKDPSDDAKVVHYEIVTRKAEAVFHEISQKKTENATGSINIEKEFKQLQSNFPELKK